jgi:hypothetical protein
MMVTIMVVTAIRYWYDTDVDNNTDDDDDDDGCCMLQVTSVGVSSKCYLSLIS